MGDLSPFDFFRQELSHEDPLVREDAMKKVLVIAAIMGAEKARADLLPYLQTKLTDLDQVLLVLATKLSGLSNLTGGPEHSHNLIPILEVLCSTEETEIRKEASLSISRILAAFGTNEYRNQSDQFIELFRRLSSQESGEVFYTRVSACQIFPAVYSVCKADQKDALYEVFKTLVEDEMTIVKRAAAASFMQLVQFSSPEFVTGALFDLLKLILADEQRIVKVVVTEQLISFTKFLKKSNLLSLSILGDLVILIKRCADDASWLVRQAMVQDYQELATLIPPTTGPIPEGSVDCLLEVFNALVHLMQDSEPEIRTQAAKCTVPFLEPLTKDVFFNDMFIPFTLQLLEDPVLSVREAIADVLVEVASKVGPEQVGHNLSDMIFTLMNDADSLVRLRIIHKVPLMSESAKHLIQRLTGQLKDAFIDKNWRVRKEIATQMAAIIRHFGKQYFQEHFLAVFLVLLKDDVSEVRLSASQAVANLIQASNDIEFFNEALLPSIKSMFQNKYLVRMSSISVLEEILKLSENQPNLIPENLRGELVNLLVTAARDKVPNIRLRCMQVMAVLGSTGSSQLRAQLRPMMAELQVDRDKDVQYFATQAMRLQG